MPSRLLRCSGNGDGTGRVTPTWQCSPGAAPAALTGCRISQIRAGDLLDLQTVNAQENLEKDFNSNRDRKIRSVSMHKTACAL